MRISQGVHDRLCDLMRDVAGRHLVDGPVHTLDSKGPLDIVTSVDLSVQAELSERLPELLPGTEVLGEEGKQLVPRGDQPHWLVDPLDGTVNFVAGLPCYAVSVALVVEGRAVLSAVLDVKRDTLYSALSGGGAFSNGVAFARRTSAAALAVLSSGLVSDLVAKAPMALEELLKCYKLRNLGSQSLHLCYAAKGHFSLVASREAKGWDDVAGALIAEESGLRYGHYSGTDHPMAADQFSLCTAQSCFDRLAGLLSQSQ